MSIYIASYDITDDQRRARVARYLLQFGCRLQLSVYEIFVEPGELGKIQAELGALLSEKDRFLLVPVDERGGRGIASWQQGLTRFDSVIFA